MLKTQPTRPPRMMKKKKMKKKQRGGIISNNGIGSGGGGGASWSKTMLEAAAFKSTRSTNLCLWFVMVALMFLVIISITYLSLPVKSEYVSVIVCVCAVLFVEWYAYTKQSTYTPTMYYLYTVYILYVHTTIRCMYVCIYPCNMHSLAINPILDRPFSMVVCLFLCVCVCMCVFVMFVIFVYALFDTSYTTC